jgi:hypothetical protein
MIGQKHDAMTDLNFILKTENTSLAGTGRGDTISQIGRFWTLRSIYRLVQQRDPKSCFEKVQYRSHMNFY